MTTPRATGPGPQELPDDQIERIVEGLESLMEGRMAAAALVGCGTRAVPALRRFLVEKPPRAIFQPRQLAVETLAELNARDALMEYLQGSREIQDPIVRYGEQAVLSSAARALAKWPTDEVYQFLRTLAKSRMLPGLLEALGTFERAEMSAYFIHALGDDVCRAAAEAALARLGARARTELLAASLGALPSPEAEMGSSKVRRRAALRLLGGLEVAPSEWAQLRQLVFAEDAELALRASEIALRAGRDEERHAAAARLIALLSGASWFLQLQAKEALRAHYSVAGPAIEAEIARRQMPGARPRIDPALRALLAIRALQAGESPHQAEGKAGFGVIDPGGDG